MPTNKNRCQRRKKRREVTEGGASSDDNEPRSRISFDSSISSCKNFLVRKRKWVAKATIHVSHVERKELKEIRQRRIPRSKNFSSF